MKAGLHRRPRFIIAVAALLYAAALGVAWWQGTVWAERRLGEILDSAERGFAAVIDGEIEAALRNVGGAIVNLLDGRCTPQSVERMREIARFFNIDELNIVNRKGIAIGSNIESLMGVDFNEKPLARDFLELTNGTKTCVSQPFRHGAHNPDMYCKYYGMTFPEHDGFIQLGMSLDRLRQNMYSYTPAESERILRDWHFSVVGWYARATDDPDYVEGRLVRRRDADSGQMIVGRFFQFEGYRYLALIPVSFCYGQRNTMFAVTAIILAVLFAFFVACFIRIARASVKLEEMHAEADLRTAGDLALARKIQMSALPASSGAFMDEFAFRVAAESRPAREVGGDFYDFYPLSDDRVAFLIADASGKGIPAALFMMEARAELKNCLVEFADLAEAVTIANSRLCANNEAQMFVTAWIGVLHIASGEVEYVNAGHNRPFVRRADGRIERVDGKGGLFLGMFENAAYRVETLALSPGDRLFVYTDGVTEAMNVRRQLFGERRLVEALRADDLKESLAAFVGKAEQSDDITTLTLTWCGEPPREERVFPCTDGSLGPVVSFLRERLASVDAKSRAALLNAADEVVSNIVSYSGSDDFSVAVECACDRIRLTFSDGGREYNPLSHVDPDTTAPIEDRPIGGLGLVMVKRLADRVTYDRRDGRNVLTLIKRLP